MIAQGVSCIVSSCGRNLRPSIMRAVGSTITPDGSEITVYVSRRQSQQLLQDIADTGHIAVVFSQPASHRTVQFKSRRASIRPADASDEPVLQRYLSSMEHEILQVGLRPDFTRAMLARRTGDLVAIRFQPAQAFDQTPGPRAGAPLAQDAVGAGTCADRP